MPISFSIYPDKQQTVLRSGSPAHELGPSLGRIKADAKQPCLLGKGKKVKGIGLRSVRSGGAESPTQQLCPTIE